MKLIKRTKIVATVGPACRDPENIENLIDAGVNVFRLNFSHGNHQIHQENIRNIRAVSKKSNAPVGILQDLSGPKIRLGKIAGDSLLLNVGDQVTLDAEMKGVSEEHRIGVNYSGFAKDVYPGARLLLADGDLEFKVQEVEPPLVHCKVLIGGNISSHKGINFPTGSFNLPALTAKDLDDLKFGLQNGVDIVALSFVRSAQDVEEAQAIIRSSGRQVPLIAKIEKHEAIENIVEILKAADGIMLARGDLGVEIDIERVPIVQKNIIRLAGRMGRPVITATQMLRSMVESPRPTRAEVTDVANAIFDGTDAVMLSEESAVGKYPVRAVDMMAKICREVENNYPYFNKEKLVNAGSDIRFTESVAYASVILARDLEAKVVFAVTRSGYTARSISKFRPKSIIVALTPELETYRSLTKIWGVVPLLYPLQDNISQLMQDAEKLVREMDIVEPGDPYVLVSGFPLGEPGSINQVKAGRF